MPELPEVETIRRGLLKNVLRKKIVKVNILWGKSVKGDRAKFLGSVKKGFKNIGRIGKLLIFELNDTGKYMLVHLKMTGQLIYRSKRKLIAGGHKISDKDLENLPNQHTRLRFTFEDGSDLFFNDLRKFGYLKIADEKEKNRETAKFGINALSSDFTWKKFESLLAGKKTSIKAFLLNQKNIAGIGNIYADEVCFAAGVLPSRRADSLSESEKKKIFQNITKILEKAIECGGTTFRDYKDSEGKRGGYCDFLKVYGRAGLNCLKCGKNKLKKTKIAGRGSVYCPVCQK